jgi:hypothetical protein
LWRKLVPDKQHSLEQFAYRVQAPVDAVKSAAISVAIVLVSSWGLSLVDVVPPPPPIGHFKQSLFGSLFPMAIMMTLMTTLMGVRGTVKKRIAGTVVPPLDPGVRWFKPALAAAILRAFAAFGLISMFGLITHYKWPQAAVSVPAAVLVVAVVAAALGYVESVAAVLKTRDLE